MHQKGIVGVVEEESKLKEIQFIYRYSVLFARWR
jgi:hypothetical protein